MRTLVLFVSLFSMWGSLVSAQDFFPVPHSTYYGGGYFYNDQDEEGSYYAYAATSANAMHVSYLDDGEVSDFEYLFEFTNRGIFDVHLVEHEGHTSGLEGEAHTGDIIYSGEGFCGEDQCYFDIWLDDLHREEIIYFDHEAKIIERSVRETEDGVVTILQEFLTETEFHGTCGDGMHEPQNEECDDNNTISGDGCDMFCRAEFCGDNIINNTGETCDDGDTISGDGCDADCNLEFCGDGAVNNNGEPCDDGNNDNGDGCDANCNLEFCGDGVVNNNDESCDDGNNIDGDGCNAGCDIEFCGDGVVNNNGEDCDDGNNTDGDGCSSSCEDEEPAISFVDSTRSVLSISRWHVCYRDDVSKQVKCWGRNTQGELGQGNTDRVGDGVGPNVDITPVVDLGANSDVARIVAGGDQSVSSSCALLESGYIKCWGSNGSGQLGRPDYGLDVGDDPGEMGEALNLIDLGTGVRAKDIDGGAWHYCAVLTDDTVKCWGTNIRGELGQEDTIIRGASPTYMGDNLPAVNLGTGRTALRVEMGERHSCVLLDNNSVKCWGHNHLGQLGLEATDNRGDEVGEMGDGLANIDFGTGRSVSDFAIGGNHGCVILDDASVKCWGYGADGMLGHGGTDHLGDAAGEMGDNLAPVDLGTGRSALKISAGNMHTCAILDDSSLKCWGNNSYGQLGLGDTSHRGDAAGEMGDNLPAVDLGTGRTAVSIIASGFTTCAVLDNGDLKCWGLNGDGQLGLNDSNNRGIAAGEMGDNLPVVNTGF